MGVRNNRCLGLGIVTAFFVVALSSPVQARDFTVKMVTDPDKGRHYYDPKNLLIHSGDTVTWINAQDEPHNVMAESVPKDAAFFGSPNEILKDQKWSYTFTTPGTYRYHCHPHQAEGMFGVIIVDRLSKIDEVKEGAYPIHVKHLHE